MKTSIKNKYRSSHKKTNKHQNINNNPAYPGYRVSVIEIVVVKRRKNGRDNKKKEGNVEKFSFHLVPLNFTHEVFASYILMLFSDEENILLKFSSKKL